jgi:hypothetical protein
MQLTDIRNPDERKKLIWAGVLGVIALVLLWWTFFGFGGAKSTTSPRATSQPTPSAISRTTVNRPSPQTPMELKDDDLERLRPISYAVSTVSAPEARRNIFAFEAPKPSPSPTSMATPTPTPTPPVLLASISPNNVYARTADFTLEVSGDKLTPQLRIVIDNNELPTRYLGPQQVSATVPAAIIANPGSRQVMLRSADGKLYSNSTTLNIATPPTPNYNYVGILGTRHYVDTAILQDRGSKEILNVQRGDLLGGRFRVTSISDKELVVMDTNLKIKHTLAFSVQGDRGNPSQRPTPRIDSDDDEP